MTRSYSHKASMLPLTGAECTCVSQVVRPDGPLSKTQASEIIDSLQNGSYEPDTWTVPF